MLDQHRLRRQNREKALTLYEFLFVTKSGDIRTIYLTSDVIPGTKKSVASLLDITERKRAEEAVQKSEQNYRSVIENLQDVFYRADAAGNIIMASPSVTDVFGTVPSMKSSGSTSHVTFIYTRETVGNFKLKLLKPVA